GAPVRAEAAARPRAAHRSLQRLGMERPAPPIDVLAVGVDADRGDRRAELLEDLRADLVGSAVAAIDRDPEAVERQLPRKGVLHEDVVAAGRGGDPEGLADLG